MKWSRGLKSRVVPPIVLRYSDYEAATANEHIAIIQAVGYVWWGWWKKRHEAVPTEALRALRATLHRGSPVTIGLLNRADHDYYEATCDGLHYTEDATPLAVPDRQVPEYYGARRLPAWFRFSSIRAMDPTTWVERYGPVPIGDDTLFWSTRGHVAAESRIDVSGIGILHLSDLHFGADHGYVTNGTVKQNSLVEIVAKACDPKPAVIVVSGDVTTRGDPSGFTSARVFIERLLQALDATSESLVIVPGNHDILLKDSSPTRDFEIEQQYRDFLQLVYGRRVELERMHWTRDEEGMNYLIAAVNSARPRSRSTMDYGYVGSDRSEPVLRAVNDAKAMLTPSELVLSALVLHHHILPAQMLEHPEEDRPVSLTLDAGELVSLCQRYGVDVIMHGHQHLPFVARTGRLVECGEYASDSVDSDGGVWVLGAGSAGVGSARLSDEMRYNSISRYRVASDCLNASILEYSPRLPPRTRWSVNLPLSENG